MAVLLVLGCWYDARLYLIQRGDIANAISASLTMEIRAAL